MEALVAEEVLTAIILFLIASSSLLRGVFGYHRFGQGIIIPYFFK